MVAGIGLPLAGQVLGNSLVEYRDADFELSSLGLGIPV